jgi:hypothetical protein
LALKKQPLVVGVNMTEPSAEMFKEELRKRWLDPWSRDPFWAVIPVLNMRSLALAGDEGKRGRVSLHAKITFENARQAEQSADAVQDALILFRLFDLGQARQDLLRRMEAMEDPREPLFAASVFKQGEALLRSARVEQREASVLVQAEGTFDLTALRKKADAEAKALLGDEKAQMKRQHLLSIRNLKNIGLALHGFHDANRGLPPGAICSKVDGKPLLSWRVAILPYIDETPLFHEFKLDEPWDSPHNIKLLSKMPKVYAPIGVKTKEPYTTFYQAFVGPGAVFETIPDKDRPFGAKTDRTLIGITDGTTNTIGVVEAFEPVPWSKPADLVYDEKKPLPKVGGMFKDSFNAVFMDAIARTISKSIDEKSLRAFITRNGGEPVDWSKTQLP